MKPINKTVNTTNEMLQNQARRYNKYEVSRMESKPIFCTYFAQLKNESVVSKGLGQVYEKAGDNSPLRFAQINNLPLYGFKEFNRETRKDELKGVNVELDNESLVPPTQFQPVVGDYLIINLPKLGDLLFEVSLADPTTILQNPHYRIAYTYVGEKSKDNKSITDVTQLVVQEYDFILTNIGDEYASLLDVGTVDKIRKIVALYARLNAQYLREFYDDVNNLIVYKYMCYDNPELPVLMNYYAPALVEFQMRHAPIKYEFTQTYEQDLVLSQEIMEYVEYDKTPYGDLSTDHILGYRDFKNFDVSKFDTEYINICKLFIRKRFLTSLNMLVEDKQVVMALQYPSDRAIISHLNVPGASISKETVDKVKLTHKKDIPVDTKIVQLIKDVINDIDNIVDILSEYSIESTVENYLFAPILLYLLKNVIDGLQRNPEYLLNDLPGGGKWTF